MFDVVMPSKEREKKSGKIPSATDVEVKLQGGTFVKRHKQKEQQVKEGR